MPRTKLDGAWGEALAAQFLRDQGYQIVAAGFHSRCGEIDLVAENKMNLVFVEVKMRKNANFAAASDYVDRRKQDKLRVTASIYLSKFPTKLQPRFDVIEVYAPQGRHTTAPKIHHMEDAFQ